MNRVKTDHTVQKPFIDHLHELQIRLTWSVLAIIAFGVGAYSINDKLLAVIQNPLGQKLYYTSPTGGFSFIFKMSAVAGIVASLPVILYHLFRFLGPLLGKVHRLSIIAFTMWSINLAYAGILFAYFFSLPAALHFLAKFGGESIESLITADEYFNFALAYLGGFAILFQLPLVILFINKITPLKPGRMMSAQRYVILVSFVLAAILTPTPDPINQAIMAVPVILLYQLSIILVIAINHSTKKSHIRRRKHMANRQKAEQVKHLLPVPEDLRAKVAAVQARPVINPVSTVSIQQLTTQAQVQSHAQSRSQPVMRVTQVTTIQRAAPVIFPRPRIISDIVMR